MADTPLQRPASKTALFWAFSWLALQGFGGVVAIVQREMVERRRWLTHAQFLDDWSVAQVMPGPNVVNLSLMLGGRFFGGAGAAVALAGMLCLPLVILLVLVVALGQWVEVGPVQGALRGLGAVAAGLLAGTGLRMLAPLRDNAMGPVVCTALACACFVAVAWWRLPLAWVLLGCAPLTTWAAARAIRRQGAP
ncbi:MAG: chromate transporter [Burkholderiaceae bacterium]|nr:chromate transporter [Burkholderiaceae bacterium]MDZ4163074.1 chromate transporter [Burkholderiales bacterium]